jgi:hypothetical protein
MKVEVLKSFKAGDRLLSRGDIVDAGGWANLGRLLSSRYVRPAEDLAFSDDVREAIADARESAPSTLSRRGRSPKKA